MGYYNGIGWVDDQDMNEYYRRQLMAWQHQQDAAKYQEAATQAQNLLGGMILDPNTVPGATGVPGDGVGPVSEQDQLANQNRLDAFLQQHAGQPNEYGYVDPRMNPALQSTLRGWQQGLASGNPVAQSSILEQMGVLSRGIVPNAPKWRDPMEQYTGDMKNYEYAQKHGFDGSFADWIEFDNQHKQQQINIGGPTIQNSPQFEHEYDKTVGKAQAEDFLQLQKAPQETISRLQMMSDIHSLLGDRGGFGGSTLQQMKLFGDRLGFNFEGLDADQAASALSNRLTLEMRNTSSGAGMPGAMSDADREFLRKTVPSIDMTPAGRAKYLEIQRRLLSRQQELADAARMYAGQNNGRLDYNFNRYLEQIRSRSLFADIDVARPDSGSSSSTAPTGGISNFRRTR